MQRTWHTGCHIDSLLPHLRSKFVPLLSSGAEKFVDNHPPHSCTSAAVRMRQFLASSGALKNIDASALFGHNPMHVLDTASAEKLLGGKRGRDGKFTSLLDVGAGAGEVTEQLRPLFNEVTATEASACCAWRLKKRGINCLHTCELEGHAELQDKSFSVISLLNVLDRCSQPRKLLRNATALLAEDGRLLVGVVAPYEPFVVTGGGSTLLGRFFVSTSVLGEEERLMSAAHAAGGTRQEQASNSADSADSTASATATDAPSDEKDLVWETTVRLTV
jgi:SAM-dependent methyltransferase